MTLTALALAGVDPGAKAMFTIYRWLDTVRSLSFSTTLHQTED